MYSIAFDFDISSTCIEALIDQISGSCTIDGISIISTQFIDIQALGSFADLLIRIEAYTDFTVRHV